MKKLISLFLTTLIVLSSVVFSSCSVINDIVGGGNSDTYTKSYEPITGKFYLYETLDKRIEYTDTYFDIDGSKGNFSLKYYENGILKKEGVLPNWFGQLNKKYKTPENAIIFIMIISFFAPFFGRTALGWSICINSFLAIRAMITARIHLMPPEVEPAQAPQ